MLFLDGMNLIILCHMIYTGLSKNKLLIWVGSEVRSTASVEFKFKLKVTQMTRFSIIKGVGDL